MKTTSALTEQDKSKFYQNVIKTESCWLWASSKPGDYGHYYAMSGITVLAHRASYVLEYGDFPNELLVCHTCDVPSCVRPDHLFLGTAQENRVDCVQKGRANNKPGRTNSGYREYVEVIDGKMYGAVSIPTGNGRYKKRRKRVANKTEARQWAQAQLAEVSVTVGTNMEFRDLVKWYEQEHLVPPVYKNNKRLYGLRTWKSQRRMAHRMAAVFGDFQLDEVNVDTLTKYKRKQLATVEVCTVNRQFALLRTMFKKAKQRQWMKENPFDIDPGLIETSLENKRTSPLNDRTVKRLLARSRKSQQPLLYYVLLTLAHTGARPSEIWPYEANDRSVAIEPLTWRRILEHDFKAVELVSYKGRVRQSRMVPTSVQLEKGLRELYGKVAPADDDLVFNVTTFKRSWATLCRSVGVTGVRMRDFRHYFNSYLVSRPDINDMERLLILGHSEISTNVRYSKLDEKFVEKFRKYEN